MIHIKLPDSVKNASPENKRTVITGDETWAFTEHRRKEASSNSNDQLEAHDLFNLFTADIIKKKVKFIR